jgi:predicted acetyltransferase
MAVTLIHPDVHFELAYRAFRQEFLERGEEFYGLWRPEEQTFAEFIRRVCEEAEGRNLPKGWVPASRYWLLRPCDLILGEIIVRHRLTPALEDYGGHIGYWVRPSERGKGYGTRMLEMALDQIRSLRLTRVLITCDPKNTASVRVIEKNGGVLASQSVAHTGRMTSRYWIDLS